MVLTLIFLRCCNVWMEERPGKPHSFRTLSSAEEILIFGDRSLDNFFDPDTFHFRLLNITLLQCKLELFSKWIALGFSSIFTQLCNHYHCLLIPDIFTRLQPKNTLMSISSHSFPFSLYSSPWLPPVNYLLSGFVCFEHLMNGIIDFCACALFHLSLFKVHPCCGM